MGCRGKPSGVRRFFARILSLALPAPRGRRRTETSEGEARRGAGAANIFDAAAYRPPPFEPISGKEQRQRGARVVALRGAQRKLSATKSSKERTEDKTNEATPHGVASSYLLFAFAYEFNRYKYTDKIQFLYCEFNYLSCIYHSSK